MKAMVFFFLISTSPLMAYQSPYPIPEETKLKFADWVGSGLLQKKVFFKDIDGEHVWRVSFVVSDTVKGDKKQQIDVYFEQPNSPNTKAWAYRCPEYPEVPDLRQAKLYLHKRIVEGREVYFLNGTEMIQVAADTK